MKGNILAYRGTGALRLKQRWGIKTFDLRNKTSRSSVAFDTSHSPTTKGGSRSYKTLLVGHEAVNELLRLEPAETSGLRRLRQNVAESSEKTFLFFTNVSLPLHLDLTGASFAGSPKNSARLRAGSFSRATCEFLAIRLRACPLF